MLKHVMTMTATVLALAAAVLNLSSTARAADAGFTTLDVNGEAVRIYRDDFGTPHIFAETNRGLFEAYGYTVAQDRLWQLELNRRAARGRLAEVFGPGAGNSFLNADRAARTTGYTGAELDAQFAMLTAEEQEIFDAYLGGINRYIGEAALNPLSRLPFEFHALGFFPEPWTRRDSAAFGAFMVRRFGEIGGRELTNLSLLDSLIAAHGPANGFAIFNDVRWVNDPDSPVTVPSTGAFGKRQKKAGALNAAQLRDISAHRLEVSEEEAREAWASLGVPTKLGSYAWAVSAARSDSGYAMLYGGPQMGFSVPEVLHEVQLKGGNGFNVAGMAFAGVPPVLIGRNDHLAWTSTTATGDNLDHYIETTCNAGAGPGSGYVFNGACQPFEARVEVINVRGAAPVNHTVLRSVHGPVVGTSGANAITQKRAHWQRELESVHGFFGFDRARNIQQFEAAVRLIPTSHNFIYADKGGNIAYWQAGQVPLRPAGFDARLPFPGDGSAEWPGGILPIPTSINPAQGYLANWNNKPSVDYDNADNQIFGKQFRLWDIDDRLATGVISLEDMRDIPKDIARVKGNGREARFLKPHLLAALNDVPPAHPLAAQAKAIVEAWDGNAFTDAVTSTSLQSGEVIFSTWLSLMITNSFGDELGSRVNEASSNMLIHALDFALAGNSGVPPSRDYFNGVNPKVVISATFDQTLAVLAAAQGNNPAAWTGPRGSITFTHPLVGVVASIPNSNRATYGQIVVLGRPKITGESIFTLGQSGFLHLVLPNGFAFDPHFNDQLGLFRNFEYKPM
ncbi:MAG TPA: penicillin acylase family protein, partial [Pyrinomonadaceae bacterium]